MAALGPAPRAAAQAEDVVEHDVGVHKCSLGAAQRPWCGRPTGTPGEADASAARARADPDQKRGINCGRTHFDAVQTCPSGRQARLDGSNPFTYLGRWDRVRLGGQGAAGRLRLVALDLRLACAATHCASRSFRGVAIEHRLRGRGLKPVADAMPLSNTYSTTGPRPEMEHSAARKRQSMLRCQRPASQCERAS